MTVNVGRPPPLTWLIVGSGASVLVPTLVEISALPWLPVTGCPVGVLEAWPLSRARTVFGSSQPMFGRKRLGGVVSSWIPFPPSACWTSGATRWE